MEYLNTSKKMKKKKGLAEKDKKPKAGKGSLSSSEDVKEKEREGHRSQLSLLIERKDLFQETKSVTPGGPRIYKLVLHEEYAQGKYRKLQFGAETPLKQHKIIMLVGTSGSGKTTLINALINYILGVKWEDNYRLILIEEDTNRSQAHSQTSEVTAYQLNHIEAFTVPYNLTIIDTPGFDDTRGRDLDKDVPKQLKLCFDSPGSISHIDAIYFVLQSSLARLTSTQEYIFGSMLSIFAKDIEKNIQICATFAHNEEPQVLQALIESKVACVKNKKGSPVYFKFNNCGLYAKKPEDKAQWEIGDASSHLLLNDLDQMKSKSLTLTKEVLEEREALESILHGFGKKIEEISLNHNELSKLSQVLKEKVEIVNENRNYEHEIKENKKKKLPIERKVWNCEECQSTCLHSGDLYARFWTWWRLVIGAECTVCDHSKQRHIHENYEWINEVITVKVTHEELKEKYEKANNEKLSTENLIAIMEKEKKDRQEEGMKLIGKASRVLRRLQEISLKPDPLSVTDYINLLINKERQEGKPGFQERIQSLEEFQAMEVPPKYLESKVRAVNM